jgi:hypothetical protein
LHFFLVCGGAVLADGDDGTIVEPAGGGGGADLVDVNVAFTVLSPLIFTTQLSAETGEHPDHLANR